ncbi:helix-turn-helix transcriptional regulator [Glutamicibacter sp. JL.03c]|uniref:AraC family transcriptional regulator n=1 Tax=Glutamicibacter sp. JL.03c TaxID=2984842 RepID=UPI0021F6D933|nr:helix-turn-helix transcriptional regulator [Glutamicibacter sp. JL.03c]UYQ77758.1 helix-turn-helix transcriptional regulator [Glutamicibacter sp. JL.03c]
MSTQLLQQHLPANSTNSTLDEIRAPGQVTSRKLGRSEFAELCDLADSKIAFGRQGIFGQLSYFYRVLDALDSSIAKSKDRSSLAGLGSPSAEISIVQQLMRENLDTAWTIARLASAVSFSASHLTRLFQRDTGSSPMAYLNQLRAERMALLLREQGISVASAGRAVGWHDASYATRRFGSHYGVSPSKYRIQH